MGALSILIGAIGGIGGTEYRDFIRQETIRIDSMGSALAATAEFIVEDSLEFPRTVAIREQSEITIDDGATRLFGGWVKVVEDSHDGAFRAIRVRCTDYTLQLEESIVVDTFQAAGGSDHDLILDMIGHWATDIDATVAGNVDTIRAAMPEMRFADITCREALDQICKKTGGMYYVDFRKKLHYFEADEGVAVVPFLSTEADMINSFPYTSDFQRKRDATKLVNNVRVIGNGVETWREDAASILYYDNRRFQTVIRDSNADTTAEVEYLGDWFLARYAWASYEFDVTCWIPGLRAGNSIRLVNSVWGIDATYSIRKTNLRCTGAYPPVSPQYIVQLTLGYKDAPGRPDFDPDDRIPPVPPTPKPPVPPSGGWAKNVYVATEDFGVYYTSNFVTDERYIGGVPTWTAINTGLNLAHDCLGFRGDPFDPAGRQYYLGEDALYRRVAGGNWVSVLTLTQAATLGGGVLLNSQFGDNGLTCNINVKGFVAVVVRVATGATYKFGWCVSTNYGANWVYKNVFTSATSTQIFCPEVGALKGSSPYAAGTVWYCGSIQLAAIGHFYRSLDNGATWTEITTSAGVASDNYCIHVDPNDQSRVFISAYRSGGQWRTAVSTNHGTSFTVYDTGCSVPTGSMLYSYYHISAGMDVNKTVRIGANSTYGANNLLHRTINNALNWTEVAPQYSNASLGISLIHDAPTKLYLMRRVSAAIGTPHVIFASENEGLNMIPKAGANAGTAGTGGGDSIPFDCGGVRGILQVWTARTNTSVASTIVPPSHELGSAVHTGELTPQQLPGFSTAPSGYAPIADGAGNIVWGPAVGVQLSDIETYQRFAITAHRGDINQFDGYPENTLAACLSAARKGAHRIEVDPRLDADGTWYLMHDVDVDRTTDGAGNVSTKTDAQMNALNIDGGYGYNAGRHLGLYNPPTLLSVLNALAPYDVTIQLDQQDADAGTLAAFVVAQGWTQRVVITCATQAAAQAVKAVNSVIAVMGPPSETGWAEIDIVQWSWGSGLWTEAAILAVAPKSVSIYLDIADYGAEDVAAKVRDIFDAGARYATVPDVDVALAEWRAITFFTDMLASKLATRFEPTTNGIPAAPEIVFDGVTGDVVMAEVSN